MDIRELQSHWHQFGATDPLWAILTVDEKRGGKWDVEEFFGTGRTEIRNMVHGLSSLGMPKSRQAALDFGCGVGRLTQAMCEHFDGATGVDIAPSMIERADHYNRHGERCRYVLNGRDDLSVFASASFDFIYSIIVLQHMRPEYARRYIQEFVRLLRPGGVAVFQIPSELAQAPPRAAPPGGIPALSRSALKARISPWQKSLAMETEQEFIIQASIENLGDSTWPVGREDDPRRIRLGNHWRDKAGKIILFDDARVEIPAELPPRGKVNLSLTLRAPGQPGDYVLELDMVQESVAWFASKGSTPARIPVLVHESVRQEKAEGNDVAPQPKMEMYGIPLLEVIKAVVAAGGALLDVREDSAAGTGWIGYRYYVSRRP